MLAKSENKRHSSCRNAKIRLDVVTTYMCQTKRMQLHPLASVWTTVRNSVVIMRARVEGCKDWPDEAHRASGLLDVNDTIVVVWPLWSGQVTGTVEWAAFWNRPYEFSDVVEYEVRTHCPESWNARPGWTNRRRQTVWCRARTHVLCVYCWPAASTDCIHSNSSYTNARRLTRRPANGQTMQIGDNYVNDGHLPPEIPRIDGVPPCCPPHANNTSFSSVT